MEGKGGKEEVVRGASSEMGETRAVRGCQRGKMSPVRER